VYIKAIWSVQPWQAEKNYIQQSIWVQGDTMTDPSRASSLTPKYALWHPNERARELMGLPTLSPEEFDAVMRAPVLQNLEDTAQTPMNDSREHSPEDTAQTPTDESRERALMTRFIDEVRESVGNTPQEWFDSRGGRIEVIMETARNALQGLTLNEYMFIEPQLDTPGSPLRIALGIDIEEQPSSTATPDTREPTFERHQSRNPTVGTGENTRLLGKFGGPQQ
jgi:hypothetical protein